jgi:HlyD family secretion protein
MKKIWIAITIGVVLVALIGTSVYRTTAGSTVEVESVELKEEEISAVVMIPGTLQLDEEQSIYYEAAQGVIEEILVNEDDDIKKGTPLFRYASDELELEKEQNQLTIESHYLRINTIDKQEKRLEEQEEELKIQFGKKEAEEQIEPELDQLSMDKRMENIELRQALLQKKTIEKRIKELEIKSEIDGTVLEINEDAGMLQNQVSQEPVIHIATLDRLTVSGLISEYDTLKVEEGQPVVLRSDAVSDKEWKGTVTEIGYLSEEGTNGNGGAVQYPVTDEVNDSEIGLKPGFQLIMEIETEKHTGMTIPLTAVQQEENEQIVYVVKNGKAERRMIQIGTTTKDRIEILEGIQAEEKVIISPLDKIRDGVDVSVQ